MTPRPAAPGVEVGAVTLVEFLLQRLSEDEERADETHLADCVIDHIDSGRGCSCVIPARVLADVAAKRRIVDLHSPSAEFVPGHVPGRFCEACADWDDENDEGQPPTVPWPCPTLLALASVHADHPDFDPAWAAEVAR